MSLSQDFEKLGDSLKKETKANKRTAYDWQALALVIINELKIPPFKRSSVFKVVKENEKNFILNCFNDTKELCKTGEKWKYFFKLITKKDEL